MATPWEAVEKYIEKQKAHDKKTFQEEYMKFFENTILILMQNIFGHNYTDTIICVAPSGRHILIANYPTALPRAGLFRPFRAVFT